ncbi:MAG: type IIA DNA topoisomerase subunit B [Sphaerochaetaceae bacterium]|nr:type IIA DNA topoisomerase subunit B [Sphaerochaetaceae bacterium]
MAVNYNEKSVKTLAPLEHVRLRPGMYIGRLGDGSHVDDGIYILLKEIIDNSIDEFIMGAGSRVIVTCLDGKVTVRDYGRGIPLGKLVDCVSVMNTGAKYDSEAFQFSVGLNGVGTKAVNALSEYFTVTSYQNGKFASATFEKGVQKGKTKTGTTNEPNGTYTEFIPDHDPTLFGDYSFNEEFIEERLWNYAYLNTGITFDYNRKIIKSKQGLMDLLQKKVDTDGLYPIIYYKSNRVEFAFTHTNSYGESYFSYVNGQHTSDGGTHLAAFKEGVLKGINEYFKKSWNSPEIRDGICSAISVKVENPIFESQTKNKLGNNEIRSWVVSEVKEGVIDFLMKNTDIASQLQNKIATNEKIHKEESAVRNGAREMAKRVSINIPKLKDCRYHLNSYPKAHEEEARNSMIFLTEGDSASGTINKARNPQTQAVFSLRGKPFNVYGKSRKAIYENQELYNIMVATGLENGDFDNLRYSKVIIATDADVDGYHIRNLLMTYFLTFFEELITSGRLFILETPLFRVRNKQVITYCYSEKERDAAIKQIRGAEVTRFKGLGEISPSEFGQFIGDDIRLSPVTIASMSEVRKKMEFYMGNNTPERREYIMQNLVMEDIV